MQDAKRIRVLLEKNKYNDLIYSEIFRILTKKYDKYSKNSSGVFFDLREVPEEDLKETREYIEKINETFKKHSTSYDNILTEYSTLKASLPKERKTTVKVVAKTKKKNVPTPVIMSDDEEDEYPQYSDSELFGDENSDVEY